MAYFNIEDLSKIKGLNKESIFPVLRIVIMLVLAGIIIAIVFFQEKRETTDEVIEKDKQQLSEKEKIKILESLSAPSSAPEHTKEEKKQILESLSAPQGSVLSDEEKRVILESLGVPKK